MLLISRSLQGLTLVAKVHKHLQNTDHVMALYAMHEGAPNEKIQVKYFTCRFLLSQIVSGPFTVFSDASAENLSCR